LDPCRHAEVIQWETMDGGHGGVGGNHRLIGVHL
jgi:hypothetical protein